MRLPRLGFRKLRPVHIVKLLCLLAGIVAICVVLDARSAPKIKALAALGAKQQATEAISAAIEEVLVDEHVTYDSLVYITQGADGIRSIQTDAVMVNVIRGKINHAVEEAIAAHGAKLKLPLGALLGSDLFAGAGPKLPITLTMAGHAQSVVQSDLVSSGINQTMHRVLLQIDVSLSVILPDGIVETALQTVACLAETVIVGDVPQGLLAQK